MRADANSDNLHFKFNDTETADEFNEHRWCSELVGRRSVGIVANEDTYQTSRSLF